MTLQPLSIKEPANCILCGRKMEQIGVEVKKVGVTGEGLFQRWDFKCENCLITAQFQYQSWDRGKLNKKKVEAIA